LRWDDKDSVVRLGAQRAPGHIGHEGPVEKLIQKFRDGDWSVKMGVALALVAIWDEKNLTYLRAASCDENEYSGKSPGRS
jgi:HEAT repeat protein